MSLPLASLFGPDAVSYRLSDSNAKAAIVHPANRAKVDEAAPHLPVVETGPQFDALCSGPGLDQALDTRGRGCRLPRIHLRTTGPPKGALHAHRSLFGHLPAFDCYYEFAPRPGDLIWTPADWRGMGGLMDVLIPAWYYGIAVLTAEDDFDPAGSFGLMAEHGVTLAFLPATALKMMRASGASRSDLSLRAIFTRWGASGV